MKRTGMIKSKLSSVLLAVTMLIGVWVIGMGSADAIEADVATYRYNLHALQTGRGQADGVGPSAVDCFYKTMNGNSQRIVTYVPEGDEGGLVTGPYPDADTDPFYAGETSPNARWIWGDPSYVWTTGNVDNVWVSLHILVPTSDTYSVETCLGVWAHASEKIKLYIAPVDAVNPRDEQYRMRLIDCLVGTTNWKAIQYWNLEKVNLEAGEYIVSYVQEGAGYIVGGSLTLIGTKPQDKMTITPQYQSQSKASVVEGQETRIPLTVSINGTERSDWSTLAQDIVIDPVDDTKVTAVLDNDELVISGVQQGETSVNVRMTVDHVMAWVEIPVSVSEDIYDIDLITLPGAQVRIKEPCGLRFISSIQKSDIVKANVVEYGTILIPSADITDPDQFVIGATLNGDAVVKVPAQYRYEETAEEYQFTAVITQIAEQNYIRKYSARAYAICENGRIIYSKTTSSRDVYYVALAALDDPNSALDEGAQQFLQRIVDVVDNFPIFLTIAPPVEGETAQTTVGGIPENARYTANVSWKTTGGVPFSGEFVSGTDYTLTICLTRTSGTFGSEIAVSLNGEELPVIRSEDGTTLTLSRTYEFRDHGYTPVY